MKSNWFPAILGTIVLITILWTCIDTHQQHEIAEKAFAAYVAAKPADTVWRGWGKSQIPYESDSGKLIWYGRELIANTSYYLGPKGTVAKISNGMNCQNCHLDGGTIPFGNNFGKVYATYPRFSARNNDMENIYDRVNDCMERSLNGHVLDTASREMQAMYAYMKWVGKDVPKGVARGGTGIAKLKYLERAANPFAGRQVYISKCKSCHGVEGEGLSNPENTGYVYPPLWGEHSYNDAAGLYRISNFAGFVKTNMPFGTDYHQPNLTDEEAWDVAAFVNSQPRPHKDQSRDWKNIAQKPIDFPNRPYEDSFSEKQHKFGPFIPIKAIKKTMK